MRSRQARKIVRMVRYTPIDRMSDTWMTEARSGVPSTDSPTFNRLSAIIGMA